MASRMKRIALRPLPYLFTDWVGQLIARLFSRKLMRQFCGEVTDTFVELLLKGMDLAFCLSKGFRKNIRGFEGRYLFQTADGLIVTSATFRKGNMRVHEAAIDDWDVRVTFKDAPALNAFLFSKDQDILDSVLADDVEVDGNMNYVYKFGFMARDLSRRLGVG
ncbi:MAG: hypothetical protein JSV84_05090 [Gemmatimonadota bacterium]|nr:MAG: hypothetical protein JSV84_05090 [Gemmatimonadota bacterium]